MRLRRIKVWLSLAVLAVALTGCTKDSSDDGDSGGSVDRPVTSGSFRTDCGTVVDGSIENPVSAKDGTTTRVTVVGPNLLSVSMPDGLQLVKLLGLGVPSQNFQADGAMTALREMAASGAVFFPASEDCTVTLEGGGKGTIGQLFTTRGKSYSEELISRGLAKVERDPCGGEQVYSCYIALEEEAVPESAGELKGLLWKPVSDSNGLLAVHTTPYNVTVKVNGEAGRRQGPGNGYGDLARFGKSGCSYGQNVKVEVFNSQGVPYTVAGQPYVIIPNGCNRYRLSGTDLNQEFK